MPDRDPEFFPVGGKTENIHIPVAYPSASVPAAVFAHTAAALGNRRCVGKHVGLRFHRFRFCYRYADCDGAQAGQNIQKRINNLQQ